VPIVLEYQKENSPRTRESSGAAAGVVSGDVSWMEEKGEFHYLSRWQARKALPSQIETRDPDILSVLEEALTHPPYLDLGRVYQDMMDEYFDEDKDKGKGFPNVLLLQFGESDAILPGRLPKEKRVVISNVPKSLRSKYEAFQGSSIDRNDLWRDADPFLHRLVDWLRSKNHV
jgi:hypothetical protein